MHYLAFIEWRTTTAHHPTMRPSHPLLAPVNEWHTYSPTHEHDYDTIQPTPRKSIATFQSSVCFQPTSTTNTHSLAPLPLTILYHAITEILSTYNSPLVLTIDGSFKPSNVQHIFQPQQPQWPTIAHATACAVPKNQWAWLIPSFYQYPSTSILWQHTTWHRSNRLGHPVVIPTHDPGTTYSSQHHLWRYRLGYITSNHDT